AYRRAHRAGLWYSRRVAETRAQRRRKSRGGVRAPVARVAPASAAPTIDAADRAASLIPLLVIAAAAAWAYHDSFQGRFIFDDKAAIPGNWTIRHLSDLGMVLSPRRDSPVAGRPITNLSLAINYAIGGTTVWGYHVVNLALHVVAAFLLYD